MKSENFLAKAQSRKVEFFDNKLLKIKNAKV